MGRTVGELEEALSAREWDRWVDYHNLYDLPDGFLVAGQLGALVGSALGGKARPSDFAPYYDAPPRRPARRGPGGVSPSLRVMHRVAQSRPQPA